MTTVSIPTISPDFLKMPETVKTKSVNPESGKPEPLVDTFMTLEGQPGRARVLSETVTAGRRHAYDMFFCDMPGSLAVPAHFQVVSCKECPAFTFDKACRHAVKMQDILNLPTVRRVLLADCRAFVVSAHAIRPCEVCPLYSHESMVYQVEVYAGPSGYLHFTQCPACRARVQIGGAK